MAPKRQCLYSSPWRGLLRRWSDRRFGFFQTQEITPPANFLPTQRHDLAGDLEHDLIHMPLVARPGQPPADDVGELLAELEAPLPDGLVADLDAAEGQHLLNHAQAEREAEPEGQRRRR